jgi:hypothetical protein
VYTNDNRKLTALKKLEDFHGAKNFSMFVCFNRTKFPNIMRAINFTPP